MIDRRSSLVFAVMALVFAAAAAPAAHAQTKVTRTGHVYLFREFMNVFSTGMNVLTDELRRNGIKADVYNHTAYQGVAAQAVAEYRASKGREPVFIVGHSLGADAAISMAAVLEKANVPVTLLVTYDAYAPPIVPSNVRQVINYNQYAAQDSAAAKLRMAPGFKGRVDNVNVAEKVAAVDHFNIDKLESLHQATIKAILARTRRK